MMGRTEPSLAPLAPIPRTARFREALVLARARPDLAAGLRAGVATLLPLALLPVLHRPELIWSCLAGFSAALVDKGGLYRTRALTLSTFVAAATAAAALGTAVAGHIVLASVVGLGVVALCAYARVLGTEASSVGVVTAMTLLLATALPSAQPHAPVLRAAFTLAGGLWAMVLALALWPLRVFRPVRLAVAAALDEIAEAARGVAQGGPGWLSRRTVQVGQTRAAIESARDALARFRRGRAGSSTRGEQLLVLLETGDQIFAQLIAVDDALNLGPTPAPEPAVRAGLDDLAAELEQVVVAMQAERPPPPSRRPNVDPGTLLAPLDHELDALWQVAQGLDDPLRAQAAPARSLPGVEPVLPSARALLRENLTLDSAVARYALRVALTTGAAVWVAKALALGHGYWTTITCLIILQPQSSATFTRALQRVVGTVLGAGLAIAVATWLHDPRAIFIAVFLFAVVSVSLLPLNYGLYAMFLTPTFVLLAESSEGNWGLAWVRVVNTLIGGALALLGARVLFPLSERDQFRPLIAEALAACRRLLEVALSDALTSEALAHARRNAGLALINAEAALQRLLTDTRPRPEEHEPLLTLMIYSHRLVAALIGHAVARGGTRSCPPREVVNALAAALQDLEASVREMRAPLPRPALDPRATAGIGRLIEQLDVQREAVARWQAAAP